MKAKDFLNAMQVMDEFTELVSCVYPDKYKIVCMKHGIDERDAMDMYSYLQKMKSGEYWRVSNKPKDYIERVLAMANEAYSLYTNNSLILDMANFGDNLTRILVIFEKESKRTQQEFDLKEEGTYVAIAELISSGYSVVSVIRQSDSIDSKNFVGEKRDKNQSRIPIYDGDVMLCFVKKPEFWSTDCYDCGLYICEEGSYHKLLYTPNKGYVRHGEPDTDEDFELNIEENAFTDYIMTLGQSFYKLGNIHAGIGFLVEKRNNDK